MMICLAEKMLEWANIALQSEKMSSEGEQNGKVCSGERNNHLTLSPCSSSYCSFEPFSSIYYRLPSEASMHLFFHVCGGEREQRRSDTTCMQQSWCLACHHRLPTSQLCRAAMLPHPELPSLGWLNSGCSSDGVRLNGAWRGAVLGRVAGVWGEVPAARGCAASKGDGCSCRLRKVVFKMERAE